MGQFEKAVMVMHVDMQLEFLRLVIAAVKEFYELTGSFPTPLQLRAKINRPGS